MREYVNIVQQVAQSPLVAPGSPVLFEVGVGQHDDVASIAISHGWDFVRVLEGNASTVVIFHQNSRRRIDRSGESSRSEQPRYSQHTDQYSCNFKICKVSRELCTSARGKADCL